MWLAEGHIDVVTHDRLCVALDRHDAPATRNKIIGVLVALGALLIGVGALLFVASQWAQQSPLARLAMLAAIYAATVAAAALAHHKGLVTTSNGLWFLSSLAVGANVFLVGQIFNLPLNYWQGTLLWLVATLAAGWAAPSSAQGWLAVPLAILTLGWISVPSAFFFDQFAFLFEPDGLRAALPLVGVALIAIAVLVSDSDFWWLRRPSNAIGATLIAVPLTLSAFHSDVFGWVFEMQVTALHRAIAFATVVLLVVAWRLDRASPLVRVAGVVFAVFVVVVPQVVVPVSAAPASWLAAPLEHSSVLFYLYGGIVFALSVGAIVSGLHFKVKGLITTGFSMVSVQLFAFYVVRISGALPTSLAVTFGGVLLVGGAIALERKRRDLTETALATSAAPAEVVA